MSISLSVVSWPQYIPHSLPAMNVTAYECHRLISLEAGTEGNEIGYMLGINMCEGRREEVEGREEEVKLHRGPARASTQGKALGYTLSSRASNWIFLPAPHSTSGHRCLGTHQSRANWFPAAGTNRRHWELKAVFSPYSMFGQQNLPRGAILLDSLTVAPRDGVPWFFILNISFGHLAHLLMVTHQLHCHTLNNSSTFQLRCWSEVLQEARKGIISLSLCSSSASFFGFWLLEKVFSYTLSMVC